MKFSFFNFTGDSESKQKLILDDSDERMTLQQADVLKKSDPSTLGPFTTLPEEVLEHLFKFLDSKSLLNCILVESRGKRVIEKSPKLIKNIPLVVDLRNGLN
jgi:F-box domain